MYQYFVKNVLKVVDGDTIDVEIDLGFDLTKKERVRISQNSEMKELEEKLIDKLQRALDNPLAD